MNTITNNDDVIDSRDVIERIEELEAIEAEHNEDVEADFDPECLEELEALRALAEEASSTADWIHGESLILESYFTEYIEELVNDCYELDLDKLPDFISVSIDWEDTADNCKVDYFEVSFSGVTYLVRA